MVRPSLLALAVVGALGSGADASYAITPNTGSINAAATGSVPDRLEISSMASKGGPAWDLFILCMADIQGRPQNQQDSWYQIAGIHGRPYAAWDGVKAASGSHAGGYCPHSSVLFPTWHRPYIQLLEQNVWKCAQNRAKAYPASRRQSYVNAAASLRFPYWDWVSSATLPTVATQSTITVTQPSGKVTINNPLYSYRFATNGPGGPKTSDFPTNSGYQAAWTQTVRQASSRGVTNNAAANSALKNNAGYLHDIAYQILTQTTVYGEMANNGYPGDITGAGSFENPHGTVHNAIGGTYGHMSSLDYSAFDPIFWFHHTNVDRLFALWEAINYNTWDIDQSTQSGTYAVTAGTVETDTTPLYPFSKDTRGTLWTSNDARSTISMGYTYPEIHPWGKTSAQNALDVKAAIRKLYDPQDLLSRRRSAKFRRSSNCTTDKTPPLDPSKVIIDGRYKQWTLNIEVNKFALDQSFIVFVFMGEPSSDMSEWAFDANLVASMPVMRPSGNLSDLTIYATIPLTRAMLDAVDNGQLQNLEVEGSIPHLQDNLHWHIVSANATEIPIAQVPSLKVYVTDQEVVPPSGPSDFPQYGDVTQHLNVTHGKPGGLNMTDPTWVLNSTDTNTTASYSASASFSASYSTSYRTH